jgi:hypothetical protein
MSVPFRRDSRILAQPTALVLDLPERQRRQLAEPPEVRPLLVII